MTLLNQTVESLVLMGFSAETRNAGDHTQHVLVATADAARDAVALFYTKAVAAAEYVVVAVMRPTLVIDPRVL